MATRGQLLWRGITLFRAFPNPVLRSVEGRAVSLRVPVIERVNSKVLHTASAVNGLDEFFQKGDDLIEDGEKTGYNNCYKLEWFLRLIQYMYDRSVRLFINRVISYYCRCALHLILKIHLVICLACHCLTELATCETANVFDKTVVLGAYNC